MKFAIVRTGGKQYKVTEGQTLRVEKLEAEQGVPITLSDVLLLADGEQVSIGAPFVKGAMVACRVVRQTRDDKKIVFRYHSKTRYRKKKGHRQPITEILVEKIS